MSRTDRGGSGAGAAILGLLIGGVIGAGIALLFAPVSGEEARRRIKDTSRDIRDRTVDFVDDSRDRFAELMNESRDRINDLVADSKEEMTQAVGGLRGVVDEARRAYRDRREELSAGGGTHKAENVPQAAPADDGSARTSDGEST